MSYSNYLLTYGGNTGPGTLNIQGQTGLVPTNLYTSSSGFTFNYGISPYTGLNNAGNNTWVFDCTQGATGSTAASYPSWGFNTAPILNGYVTEGNPGTTNAPKWQFNYLPIGSYMINICSNSTSLGGNITGYWMVSKNPTNNTWIVNSYAFGGLWGGFTISGTASDSSINLIIGSNNNNITNPFCCFSLYKIN
jgi:hypothetical protein